MATFHLYDFNGSVARNKNQEAVFAAMSQTRETLIAKLERERKERAKNAEKRRKIVVLQNWWRNVRAKRELAKRARRKFDASTVATVDDAKMQMRRLLFFCSNSVAKSDEARFVSLCGSLVQLLSDGSSEPPLKEDLVNRFLKVLTRFVARAEQKTPVAVPLRVFNVLLVNDSQLLFIVENGFFAAMVHVLSQFVTASRGDWEQPGSGRPPPVADSFLSVLSLPLLRISPNNIAHQLAYFLRDLVGVSQKELEVAVAWVVPHVIAFPFVPRPLVHWIQAISLPLRDVFSEKDSIVPIYVFSQVLLAENGAMADSERNATLDFFASCTPFEKANVERKRHRHMDVDEPLVDAAMRQRVLLLFEGGRMAELCVAEVDAPLNASSPDNSFGLVVSLLSTFPRLRSSLSSLTFSRSFLRRLWRHLNVLSSSPSKSPFGASSSLFKLFEGLEMARAPDNQHDLERLCDAVHLFCDFLTASLRAMDDDLFTDINSQLPFSPHELLPICKRIRDSALGVLDLLYPEGASTLPQKSNASPWEGVFNALAGLLQTLHEKDLKLHFLSDDFWFAHARTISMGTLSYPMRRPRMHRPLVNVAQPARPFQFLRFLRRRSSSSSSSTSSSHSDESDDEAVANKEFMPCAADRRHLMLLKRIPFVIPFLQRVKMFEELLRQDKEQRGIERDDALRGGAIIDISVRRDRIYEDAFNGLSPLVVPSLKPPLRVRMTNWAGADEAGIDGGGIFREFIAELMKKAFGPERGFFTLSHDQMLYPSALATAIYPEDYEKHFYFLGRILGKLIYEKQLTEMRFADFFLQLLLSRHHKLGLNHMKSYDPILFHNLKSLLLMSEAEVDSLELDFSVIVDELGSTKKLELKHGGFSQRVTAENRLEYVLLFVDFHLSKRIAPLVDAMSRGVGDVLDKDWLAMFSPHELQVLISGTEGEISIHDLRAVTTVHNLHSDADRLYMESFWRVLESFSHADRVLFLRFVTGCSREPLMGFAALSPPPGIHLSPDSSRLPTSATCMNLLKLPVYRDEATLQEKLLYAIRAGAGFELS